MPHSNKSFSFIRESYNSIKNGRYQEASVILERVVNTTVDDEYPLFLLAVSYVFTDRYQELENIFKRIRMVNADYLPYLLLQTFLHLKSSTGFEEGLSIYLELLERFPDETDVLITVARLREVDDFSLFQKEAKLFDFVVVPSPPKSKKIKNESSVRSKNAIFKFLIVLLTIIGLTIGSGLFYKYIWKNLYTQNKKKLVDIPEIENISIAGSNYQLINRINKKAVDVYYYSASKLISDFSLAKRKIKEGDHNGSLSILNKIYNSNAGFAVKQKTDFLVKFIIDIEERKYTNLNYSEMFKSPDLYRGYSIKWKGKVSNLTKKNEKSFFTLLVNYESGEKFSGIADIFSNISTEIKSGDIIELKGILLTTIGKEKKPYISAREIEIIK